MRNNPTTITTETIAENIVREAHRKVQSDEGGPVPPSVAVVKDRLNRIAQVTGVDRYHVLSSQAAGLIYEYEDRLKRGVYDRRAAAMAGVLA